MVRGNRVSPAPSVAGPTLEFGSCSPAHVAQAVEHFLGKEKVPGSNPGVGSIILCRIQSPAFVLQSLPRRSLICMGESLFYSGSQCKGGIKK
jgi:hypothetical protein